MGSSTPHDHSGVLRISQERYGRGIGNGVDSTQFGVDLEANVR